MTAEFDWWLLILGLVVGAGLVWLILADLPRRDVEIEEAEMGVEAGWIAAQLAAIGRRVDDGMVEAVLREHRAYLRLPPPDEAPPAPAASAPPSPVEPATPAPTVAGSAEATGVDLEADRGAADRTAEPDRAAQAGGTVEPDGTAETDRAVEPDRAAEPRG